MRPRRRRVRPRRKRHAARTRRARPTAVTLQVTLQVTLPAMRPEARPRATARAPGVPRPGTRTARASGASRTSPTTLRSGRKNCRPVSSTGPRPPAAATRRRVVPDPAAPDPAARNPAARRPPSPLACRPDLGARAGDAVPAARRRRTITTRPGPRERAASRICTPPCWAPGRPRRRSRKRCGTRSPPSKSSSLVTSWRRRLARARARTMTRPGTSRARTTRPRTMRTRTMRTRTSSAVRSRRPGRARLSREL